MPIFTRDSFQPTHPECMGPFYAKTTEAGQPGLSVYEHCKNTGHVAKHFYQQLPSSVRSQLPVECIALAAIHDVGKISPIFQKNIKKEDPDYDPKKHHSRYSESSLSSWLRQENLSNLEDWAIALGNHHGGKRLGNNATFDSSDGPVWQKARHEFIEKLLSEFGPLPSAQPTPRQVELASGFICVADWIASDESFFPSEGLPKGSQASIIAAKAVEQCGWIPVEINKVPRSFEEIFPFPANEFQSTLALCATKPGLYIVEAPMGSGKTEAALYAAYNLQRYGKNCGLYFGLPTRLTSERIHERVENFLAKLNCTSQARLVHSQAWLKEFSHGGGEFGAGRKWFAPRKRALLTPFGVGTLDQALLGVMRVKHWFMRLFGLCGKVVILDEVHSYVMYTGTLLDHLINALLECNCAVIVLTATLTGARKNAIFGTVPCNDHDAYPVITYRHTGEEKISSIQFEISVSKSITTSVIDISKDEAAEMAVAAAEKGNCVLWICNTVAASQECYKIVKGKRKDRGPEVGLLHSRFPVYKRGKIEEKWMSMLGKDTKSRPDGCILISTQVVEQSVDIDADLLFTDLAPTDMLLQRMGRLWRHERKNRPCCQAEVKMIAGNYESALVEDSLTSVMGKSAFVYEPYVLWRSFQVWKSLNKVDIPRDIRKLIEETYAENADLHEKIQALKKKMEKKVEKLRLMANASTAEEQLLGSDDENKACTRYSTQPQINALLIKAFNTDGKKTVLTLCDGTPVTLSYGDKSMKTIKALYRNCLNLASFSFPEFKGNPVWLKGFINEDTIVLKIQEDGRLTDFDDSREYGLIYTDELGVFKNPEARRTQEAYREEETDYELDW
ncbi:MAG: CRISPR-associated helicase Cas3' [Candidatus Wallbacteria bacterium]|nr:CRISPR-associated helicase Cas3' [Candidatus Wallbacteria bacterium]